MSESASDLDTAGGRPSRKFLAMLAVITLVGLAIRVGFVVWKHWDQRLWGDAFFYHYQAKGLFNGRGFAEFVPNCPPNAGPLTDCPARYVRQSADHPPLFTILLALLNAAGITSENGHLVAMAILGSTTTAFVGLAGRLIRGARVGLVAAALAAVYANVWLHDGIGQSESLAILLCAAMVWRLMALYRSPSWSNALILGIVGGLGALTRAEILLILPATLIPLMWRFVDIPMRDKLRQVVLSGAAMLVVIAPWVYRNMTAFEKPLYLSGGDGITMAAVSCDEVFYNDQFLGWWSPKCILGWSPPANADASERNEIYRDAAFDYMSNQKSRMPVVLTARVGRMWGFYRPGNPFSGPQPGDTFSFVGLIEGQTMLGARIGMIQYYLLMPLAAAGAIIQWRRKQPVWVFLVPALTSTLAAMLTFGNLRYRAPAEISIVLFSAIALVALWDRFVRRLPLEGELLSESPDA